MTFTEKVLTLTAQIPRGKITTYKILAKKAGNERAVRACGNILNGNKHLITIPCHRVVKSSGEVGGYVNGTSKKEHILISEGIEIEAGKVKNIDNVLWK